LPNNIPKWFYALLHYAIINHFETNAATFDSQIRPPKRRSGRNCAVVTITLLMSRTIEFAVVILWIKQRTYTVSLGQTAFWLFINM